MHRNRFTFPKTHQIAVRATIIRMIRTPTGRKTRFVTNRLLRFGEVYWDTQSTAFNLTAGEFDQNDQDKSKSTGVLFPLAQLALDNQGQIQIELNQSVEVGRRARLEGPRPASTGSRPERAISQRLAELRFT